jgi:hypothetical protein
MTIAPIVKSVDVACMEATTWDRVVERAAA